eukprot:1927059-Pyramimonas_sp.AAC.1
MRAPSGGPPPHPLAYCTTAADGERPGNRPAGTGVDLRLGRADSPASGVNSLAHLAGEQDVLARLRHGPVGGGHHKNGSVHLRRACDHVLHTHTRSAASVSHSQTRAHGVV